ncbi:MULTISPECIES: hypothetical protein [Sphingobacterium]|uniref:hypothetical protein n=1 Tax=Sphingobacterium TaxID=28453 RepID=UPI00257F7536|nr:MULTISPECIES: hypothetical protein [Sphingobacterium]
MKKVFTLILAVGTILQSCRYKTQDQDREKRASKLIEATIQSDSVKKGTISAASFIGKTTDQSEVSKMHTCLGAMLAAGVSKDKYALSQYSTSVDHCQRGQSKFVIERFLRHEPSGKSVFLIVDELDVVADYPRICYRKFQLAIENNTQGDYLVEFYDTNAEIITQVNKIWRIDLEKEKFVEIAKPKNLTLMNPDYVESDEDSTFTSSP